MVSDSKKSIFPIFDESFSEMSLLSDSIPSVALTQESGNFANSQYTCTIPGVYLFSYNSGQGKGTSTQHPCDPDCEISQSVELLHYVKITDSANVLCSFENFYFQEHGGCTITIRMEVGDIVYLKLIDGALTSSGILSGARINTEEYFSGMFQQNSIFNSQLNFQGFFISVCLNC